MSKFCSPYAQRCKEGCCDKYGECPRYSGRKCRYYYKGTNPEAEAEGAGAAAASAGATTGTAAGVATANNNPTGGQESNAETKSANTWGRKSSKEQPSNDNKGAESRSVKQAESANTEASNNKESASSSGSKKASKWSLPSPFTPGSSVNIIFWTLLGLGSVMLLFALYFCFCKRRSPTYFNPGTGGIPQRTPTGTIGAVIPGAANMGAYGPPAMVMPPQEGFGGNMVQATPVHGPTSPFIKPTYTTSTLRLSRTGPTGMQPVRM